MFNEMNFTPFIFPQSTTWFKFSKYEILEHENGMIHIIPAKNSKMVSYNPLNLYPEIMAAAIETANRIPSDAYTYYARPSFMPGDVRDSVDINEMMENNEYLVKSKQAVLDSLLCFANKYGLLGIYPIFIRYGIEEIKRRFRSLELYLYYFFPTLIPPEAAKDPNIIKDDVYKVLLYFSNSIKDSALDLFKNDVRFNEYYLPDGFADNGSDIEGSRNTDIKINSSILKQFYSEPIDLLISAFRYIGAFYSVWLEYKKGNHLPHEEYRAISKDFNIGCFDITRTWWKEYISGNVTWEERLRHFTVKGVTSSLKINISNEFELETCFESLFDVICYMLLQGISTKNQHQKIRTCERDGCNNILPFEKSTKARYCSDACKNIVSAKQFRENTAKSKVLFNQGKTPDEIASILNVNVSQVTNWLKEVYHGKH